jgi:polysaccharide export outer membrane protein
VSIEGQILRPAIYELKGGESAQSLIDLAGGMGPKAFAQSARLQRINADGFMTVVDIDLTKEIDRSLVLRRGDHLAVDAITDYKKDIVTLSGAVRHAGDFSWREGMRISDVISDRDQLNPDTDLDVALLVRELSNSADIEVLIVSLDSILSDDTAEDNLTLASRDELVVLSDYQDRADVLAPYIENLKRQASIDALPAIVRSGGTVRFPGEYPLVKGMSVKNLINLSGGLIESAYSQSAEISRLDLSNPNRAVTSILISDLTRSVSSMLAPADYVEFRTIPDYRETESITLEGEFVFPGTYVFEKGEGLSSVIQRAGGFTDEAFVGGSALFRESLLEREQMEIDRLIELLNENIAFSDQELDKQQIAAQQGAIAALNRSVATGRLVIPLADVVAFRVNDVLLKNGDRLIVGKISQEVTIIGEVHRPTSYLFDPDFSQSDYIEQSGGFKDRADKNDVYIVKAGGQVILPKQGLRGLFQFTSAENSISPGDTIIVPVDANNTILRGIPLLAEVSTIIYQLSLGAAAVKSFSNNP